MHYDVRRVTPTNQHCKIHIKNAHVATILQQTDSNASSQMDAWALVVVAVLNRLVELLCIIHLPVSYCLCIDFQANFAFYVTSVIPVGVNSKSRHSHQSELHVNCMS